MKPVEEIATLLGTSEMNARGVCEQIQSEVRPVPCFKAILQALKTHPELAARPHALAVLLQRASPPTTPRAKPKPSRHRRTQSESSRGLNFGSTGGPGTIIYSSTPEARAGSTHSFGRIAPRKSTRQLDQIRGIVTRENTKPHKTEDWEHVRPPLPERPAPHPIIDTPTHSRKKHSIDELPVCPHGSPLGTVCHICNGGDSSWD